MGKKGAGIKKYKLVVREQSWGCKVQHRELSRRRTCMHDPWTWAMLWGLPEGMRSGGNGWAGWKGQRGKN